MSAIGGEADIPDPRSPDAGGLHGLTPAAPTKSRCRLLASIRRRHGASGTTAYDPKRTFRAAMGPWRTAVWR